MSAQHTPGPWHWVDSTTDEPFRWGGGNEGYPSLRSVAMFGENKTEVRDGLRYTSFALPKFILDADTLDNPADARLIAAAPELLEACKAAKWLLLRVAELATPEDSGIYNSVCAAIAKATGAAS